MNFHQIKLSSMGFNIELDEFLSIIMPISTQTINEIIFKFHICYPFNYRVYYFTTFALCH